MFNASKIIALEAWLNTHAGSTEDAVINSPALRVTVRDFEDLLDIERPLSTPILHFFWDIIRHVNANRLLHSGRARIRVLDHEFMHHIMTAGPHSEEARMSFASAVGPAPGTETLFWDTTVFLLPYYYVDESHWCLYVIYPGVGRLELLNSRPTLDSTLSEVGLDRLYRFLVHWTAGFRHTRPLEFDWHRGTERGGEEFNRASSGIVLCHNLRAIAYGAAPFIGRWAEEDTVWERYSIAATLLYYAGVVNP